MTSYHEEHPPAAPEVIERAEAALAELGRPLPPSYKAFLAERDGGQPVENRFPVHGAGGREAVRVQYFLGAGPDEHDDLVKLARIMAERVPDGLLPFARAAGGDLLCLDGRDGRDGPVLLWDHDYEAEEPPPTWENLHEIAPDLPTLLAGLQAPPPPPPVQPQSGLRRFFGRG